MLGQNELFFDSLTEDEKIGFIDDDIFGSDLSLFDDKHVHQFARVKRHRGPRTEKYDHAIKAARDIGKLEAGEHINMIVSGNFIAGDFIEAYLSENKLIAQEILITTLSMSRENVDSLVNVKLSSLSGNLGLIISDYFFAHERTQGVEDIIQHLAGDDFFLAVAGIHTKITLIRTECGMNLVIGGSANLRSSMNIEQITIDNDQTLYDFHREWMAKILNEYHVQHQMLRRDRLWQLVANQEELEKQNEDIGRQN